MCPTSGLTCECAFSSASNACIESSCTSVDFGQRISAFSPKFAVGSPEATRVYPALVDIEQELFQGRAGYDVLDKVCPV